MLAFLRTRDLINCVKEAPDTEVDAAKLERAIGWLFLACEDHVKHHFGKNDPPLKIWTTLHQTFAETGQDLKLSAVVALTRTSLEDCDSIDDYLGRMMDAWRRCTEAKVVFDDNTVALFMIANLGPRFESFKQSLVGSGQEITIDNVKKGLLGLAPVGGSSSEAAFFSGTRRKGSSGATSGGSSKHSRDMSKVKCFGCGQLGHFRSKCPKDGAGSSSSTSSSKQHIESSKASSSSKKNSDAKFAHGFSVVYGARNSEDWFVDSGASRHMTSRRDILDDFRALNNSPDISMADDRKLNVVGCGTAHISVDGVEITVRDVLYVPGLKANLLSVEAIMSAGNRVIFDDGMMSVLSCHNNELVMKAKASNGTFKIDASHIKCMLVKNDELLDWHRKLGHLSFGGLDIMRKADIGIKFDGKKQMISGCVSCAEGKQSRAPFYKKSVAIKTKKILELIHMDVCGPMSKSLGGAKYFLVMVDDYSRKVFVTFLSEKSAVVDAFSSFKALVENQTGHKIKRLRSDNGTEFVNADMKKICSEAGIVHEKTVPYTPQQNGVSERMNRTLVERARCMLSDGDLEKELWAEAVHHAAYLINRSVNRSVDSTPEEIWSKRKPDLLTLKIFGNPAMVQVPKVKRSKWDPKSIEVQFVGYADNQKAFRFYDATSKKIIVSRDATFLNPKEAKFGSSVTDDDTSDCDVPTGSVGATTTTTSTEDQTQRIEEKDDSLSDSEFEDAMNDGDYQPPGNVARQESDQQIRRSSRVARPVVRDDYVSYFARDCTSEDPTTREDAISAHDGSQWTDAMKEELESFSKNQTWTLVDLPRGRKPVKTKWIFKRKRADDGTVVRHKARLVAKGCSQQFGIDYGETFSPVVRYSSIRLLIAMAVQREMGIDQMDAVTAYLQGSLEEEIYTTQPEGFEDGSGRVCKLHKAMYGLKQSGRQWNQCLDAALLSFNLNKSKEDPCVYYTDDGKLIVAIYVDDFLIFWKDVLVRDDLKAKLSQAFHMKDLGKANTCVGMTIEYGEGTISINQESYAREVLERFSMSDCKPSSSPCDLSQKLSSGSGRSDSDVPYREAVGSLLFLVQGTRPDLAFAVSNVSRFNDKHNDSHWIAVKRIMRYVKATIRHRLVYRKDSVEPIYGYVDADWGNDTDERRSFSGYVFLMAGAAVTWSCKRQSTVAVSSTEAEYIAMAFAAKEALWLVRVIRQFNDLQNINIKCDNQSAMVVASREAFSARTKHIDIAHHFYRQHVASGLITLEYVPSANNTADCLTKAVGPSKMKLGANGLGLLCANGESN